MALTLTKNQSISLAKTAGSSLTQVSMGLGWDPVKSKGLLGKLLGGGGEIDLDASCLLLDGNKDPIDVVWFRQLASKDGSIKHSGDNRTGEGSGDDETIHVDLSRLPAGVQYLMFTDENKVMLDENDQRTGISPTGDSFTGLGILGVNF